MTTTDELEATPQHEAPAPNIAFPTVGVTLGYTTFYGGALGACSLGLLSMMWFVATIPVGLFLGACAGVILGVILGIALSATGRPPARPERFVRNMEGLGQAIALVFVVPMNAYLVGAVLVADIDQGELWSVAAVANNALALWLAWKIGQAWGNAIATSHLRRFGIELTTPEPAEPVSRARAHDPYAFLGDSFPAARLADEPDDEALHDWGVR